MLAAADSEQVAVHLPGVVRDWLDVDAEAGKSIQTPRPGKSVPDRASAKSNHHCRGEFLA